MRTFASIFIVCLLFVLGVRPGFGAVAQAEPPPVVVEQPAEDGALPLVDIDAAGTNLVEAINGIVNGSINAAWFAPMVALLVGLLKQVKPLYKESPDDPTGVSAPALSFLVSAVLWSAAAIVTRVGVDAQFSSFMDLVVQTSPYIFGFLATLGIAPAVHEYAAKIGTPVMGSKRSPAGVIQASQLAELRVIDDDDKPLTIRDLKAYLDAAEVVG